MSKKPEELWESAEQEIIFWSDCHLVVYDANGCDVVDLSPEQVKWLYLAMKQQFEGSKASN